MGKSGQASQAMPHELPPPHMGLPEPLLPLHLLSCEAEEV